MDMNIQSAGFCNYPTGFPKNKLKEAIFAIQQMKNQLLHVQAFRRYAEKEFLNWCFDVNYPLPFKIPA